MRMSNLLGVALVTSTGMSTTADRSPFGMSHLTVVPANLRREDDDASHQQLPDEPVPGSAGDPS